MSFYIGNNRCNIVIIYRNTGVNQKKLALTE